MNSLRTQEFRQARAIFANEVRAFVQYPRVLMLVPYTLLGVFCAVWLGRLVPFSMLFVLILGCAIEPQFNNIFYRAPAEMEALTLAPMRWKTVILAKNSAAAALSLACGIVLAVVLAYFSPDSFGWSAVRSLGLCWSAALFPLLAIGNAKSLNNPRADAGWTYRDLNESIWMAGIVLIVTAPYALSVRFELNTAFVLAYALITVWYWKYISLPAAIAGAEKFFTQPHETLWMLSNSPTS